MALNSEVNLVFDQISLYMHTITYQNLGPIPKLYGKRLKIYPQVTFKGLLWTQNLHSQITLGKKSLKSIKNVYDIKQCLVGFNFAQGSILG